jgi:hypothetical protein
MKARLYVRLKMHLYNHLRHSVTYRWYTQRSLPAIVFRYFAESHRWRKVASRGHTIPNLIEIIFEFSLKHLYRFSINARGATIRFHPAKGFHYYSSVNLIRLACRHAFLPPCGG